MLMLSNQIMNTKKLFRKPRKCHWMNGKPFRPEINPNSTCERQMKERKERLKDLNKSKS